ncbi:MAG TPA: MotA/TolQ/ExbB proton channel family protein [Candidatus Limnocylindrales bacterium]|nr:MotA/TolQ/ExbB proton channel family protein [Candidatus Limnocylindrales bacterium]
MDPTAAAAATTDLSLWEMFQQGWIATYPLVLMSILNVTIIAERLWAMGGLVKKTANLTRTVYADLTSGNHAAALEHVEQEKKSPPGRVLGEVVRQSEVLSLDEVEDIAAERRFEEVEQLKRPLWILGTVASSAPFIGLFGTVVGIIKAFHSMAVMGSGGFAVVAGGISEALVATALGLGVAIIALIFYNYFQVRLDRIESALVVATSRIVGAMRLQRATAGGPHGL